MLRVLVDSLQAIARVRPLLASLEFHIVQPHAPGIHLGACHRGYQYPGQTIADARCDPNQA